VGQLGHGGHEMTANRVDPQEIDDAFGDLASHLRALAERFGVDAVRPAADAAQLAYDVAARAAAERSESVDVRTVKRGAGEDADGSPPEHRPHHQRYSVEAGQELFGPPARHDQNYVPAGLAFDRETGELVPSAAADDPRVVGTYNPAAARAVCDLAELRLMMAFTQARVAGCEIASDPTALTRILASPLTVGTEINNTRFELLSAMTDAERAHFFAAPFKWRDEMIRELTRGNRNRQIYVATHAPMIKAMGEIVEFCRYAELRLELAGQFNTYAACIEKRRLRVNQINAWIQGRTRDLVTSGINPKDARDIAQHDAEIEWGDLKTGGVNVPTAADLMRHLDAPVTQRESVRPDWLTAEMIEAVLPSVALSAGGRGSGIGAERAVELILKTRDPAALAALISKQTAARATRRKTASKKKAKAKDSAGKTRKRRGR
jgi:hypothetical protein